ncbi:hypothetical protein E5S69_31550 [Cupriavidus necator]|uniref:hypothetical protein n=1 Tax=Cupriavidus necator TaxID=106590 RepID=UPI0014907CCD|nr:hypothetical protein [Cupriavidus necator]NOV28023.1 hypothetical protein [Cupriavidus necator]
MTQDESAQIEDLLLTWYAWQQRESFREVRGMWYPAQDQTCKQYRSGDAWAAENDQYEADETKLEDLQSEIIQLCIDSLTVEQRAAIQISMCNKTGPAVWRSNRVEDQHREYQAAKLALLPALRSRGMIKAELAA